MSLRDVKRIDGPAALRATEWAMCHTWSSSWPGSSVSSELAQTMCRDNLFGGRVLCGLERAVQ